jgi:RNA polymerase sigma-70 factor (ECF subfamily)
LDEFVISDARDGDEAAWRKLYDDVAPSVRGYFRARRVADPEDLVGTIFLEIARGIATFEGGYREFRAWVFTIAHRRWVDEVRSARRRSATSLGAEIDVRSPADVEHEALSSVGWGSLLVHIEALPPAQQSAVLLRVLGDLSHDEIAAALGKTAMAVRVNYHRGIKALKAALGSPPALDTTSPVLASDQTDVTL